MLTTTQHVGELTAQISPTATARHVLPQLRQIVKSYGIEIITVELLRAGGASTALEPGLLGGAVAELVFDKRSQSAVGELSPMMAASGSIAASSGNAGCGR
jgi:chemotaxis receptor (MCP) glutamine deamidase CheD